MYRDPEQLRRHRVAMWLTAEEDRYLDALADLTGAQKAVLARTLLMRCIREAHEQIAADGWSDKALMEA